MRTTQGAGDDLAPLACPQCRGALRATPMGAGCAACGGGYGRLEGGYLDLLPSTSSTLSHTPFDSYVSEQLEHGSQRADRWLRGLVRRSDRQVLDVGCGTGSVGAALRGTRPDLDIWGVDLPGNLGGWLAAGADPARTVAGSALDLPFVDASFDLVWSLGVLEHIGEPAGAHERGADRLRYLDELLRVVRPGGRVLLVAPHKWFPLDPAHDWSTRQWGHRLFERTHLCLHRTWGSHPLMSYAEVRRLAIRAGARSVAPVPMTGYFAFGNIGGGAAAPVVPIARAYIDHLPVSLGRTPAAPFLAVCLTR